MISYLNTSYPDSFILRTKFGDVLYNGKDDDKSAIMRYKTVEQLIDLFSCNDYDANVAFYNWFNSRPVYLSENNVTLEPS